MTTIRAIWAENMDGIIGGDNTLLWHVPEDLQYFKNTTMGQPVLMGRKTWDSLPERFRPLPWRTNYVLTKDDTFKAEGAEIVHSLQEMGEDYWVIGGGAIYDLTLPLCSVIHVTQVKAQIAESVKDLVYAPQISGDDFSLVRRTEWLTSKNGTQYRHLVYVRNGSALIRGVS